MVAGRHGLEEAAATRPGLDQSTSAPAANCGPSVFGGTIVIADPVSCVALSDDTVGEVWVAGPHVAQGYWDGQNGAVFDARLSDGSGPFLRTGDLGFLRGGELFVVGRIKDLIIVNGVKYSAEDIEETVAKSDPAFTGSMGAAFAVQGDGREEAVVVQEVPRAAIASALDANASAKASAAVVGRHGLRTREILLVGSGNLPRTSSGKVQRSRARDAYLAGSFERLDRER